MHDGLANHATDKVAIAGVVNRLEQGRSSAILPVKNEVRVLRSGEMDAQTAFAVSTKRLRHLWFGKRQTLVLVRANLSCDIPNLSCVLPNLSCVLPNLSFVLPNLSFVLPNLSCAQVENSNSEFVKTKHLFARTTNKVAFGQT